LQNVVRNVIERLKWSLNVILTFAIDVGVGWIFIAILTLSDHLYLKISPRSPSFWGHPATELLEALHWAIIIGISAFATARAFHEIYREAQKWWTKK
jgi:hypothetical protein